MSTSSHLKIRRSLQDRIQAGEWALGDRIPDEVALAHEYSCARTTVNRAVRALAEDGIVIRRRKGGTRVNPTPTRQAKLRIPILRQQVEETGKDYSFSIGKRSVRDAPSSIRRKLHLGATAKALYIETTHLADGEPFAFESRWVNIAAVPDIAEASFNELSPNEWLVQSVPFSNGSVEFSAASTDRKVARILCTEEGEAVFLVDRTTWRDHDFITTMKLFYQPGFRLRSDL